jgi:hypothetical protein
VENQQQKVLKYQLEISSFQIGVCFRRASPSFSMKSGFEQEKEQAGMSLLLYPAL